MTAYNKRIPCTRRPGLAYLRIRGIKRQSQLYRWIDEGRIFGLYGLGLLTIRKGDAGIHKMLKDGRLFFQVKRG